MVMLYSASMTQVGAHFLVNQLMWCLLGLVACGMAMFIDYRHLKKISLFLFAIAVALLGLVFIDGKSVNGAQRWLEYGGFTMQPSELSKLAIIVLLAHYGERYQRQMNTFSRGVLIPGIF